MSMSVWCSSSLEPTPYPDGFVPNRKKPPLLNAFVGLVRPEKFHNYDHNAAQKAVVLSSSHLVPEGLQEMNRSMDKLGEKMSRKMDHIRTLLIDNYDSYTYNIYQELSVINKIPPVVVRNDEWTWDEAHYYLYEERAFDNIVISPGPGSPMCPADIGICLQLLLECTDIPVLGVCLGHQALGYVHGAQIVHAEQPIHGRLSEIVHDGSMIFYNIPSGRNSGFKVVRYHSLTIDEETLPKDLIPIAWTCSSDTLSFLESSCLIPDSCFSKESQQTTMKASSANGRDRSPSSLLQRDCALSSRIIMGIRHINRPHYGLQFHPESVATSYGRQMFKNFRDITVNYWEAITSSPNKPFNACMQVARQVLPLRPLTETWFPSKENAFDDYSIRNLLDYHSEIGVRHLKIRWKKLDCFTEKAGGARNIFCKLFKGCKAEETFWLDSSSVEKGRARFSFMGSKGGSLWKKVTFKLSDERNGGHLSISDAHGQSRSMYLENGFLDFLNKELQSIYCCKEEYEGLPFDFCGGYIGYIGYNLKVECGASFNRHTSSTPDACLIFVDDFLAIDHNSGDVYVVSIHDSATTQSTWLNDMQQKLLSLQAPTSEVRKEHGLPSVSSPVTAGFVIQKSRDQYVSDVENCLRCIRDGESYELCFTTQMKKDIEDVDPLTLYLRLREQNPAPYAAWLNFPHENLCICCSSPERFLQLDRDGILEAKPIKGTISRGSTPEKDEQLKLQLQYSEKDQAENLMIVDLLRNDLGQVCDPGSVHVPNLMDIETYATVHTMVSTIRGKKRENVSPIDCVRAAFPGGSMTGAPKLRSMEILDSLESSSRGVYSGSIGYFSVNKTFDLNIVIRTVVIHEGEASIGAGGAIVALSKPEDEYEEMLLKARAPSSAIATCQMESQLSERANHESPS